LPITASSVVAFTSSFPKDRNRDSGKKCMNSDCAWSLVASP
jgi:hypothetical protein